MKKAALYLTIVMLIAEFVLGIPLIGGGIVLASGYTALGAMLILYVVNVVMRAYSGLNVVVPVIGIVATVLAFIPIVGMLMHMMMVIALILDLIFVKFDDVKNDNIIEMKQN